MTTPSPRPQSISPARQAAFHILLRVATSAAHSDDLLHGPALAALSEVDRDLATALVLGTLRWQIALDARIAPLLSRPDVALPVPVSLALRLGAFQLWNMDRIPPHAALNESVELVRAGGQPQAAGMVNAILRKLVQAPAPRQPIAESTSALATRLGHPAWLVEGWVEQYGRSAAERICLFDQEQPPCPELLDRSGMPVMDAGSQLVAELAAAVGKGALSVWDCCAAPGGKTMVLAHRLPHTELLATDASPVRLSRLQQRLSRESPGHRVRIEQADAATYADAEAAFDLILCDVPCSGTGTLARNPEIRHRVGPEDLTEQAERQVRILSNALKLLAPGGHLVYSTCSLEGEECQGVVRQAVQKAQLPLSRVAVAPVLRDLQSQGILAMEQDWKTWVAGDDLRTLPGAGFPADGFYAAVLRRK